MSFGSVIAKTWLYETISALPEVVALGEGRVWERKAPPETETPYIVFFRVATSDHGGIGSGVTSSTLQYQWAAIDDGIDDTTIEAVADAIDAATDNVVTTVSGYQLTSCRIQEIPTDDPTEEGKEAVWLGGTLEVWVGAS